MQTWEAIRSRRSVRAYTPEPDQYDLGQAHVRHDAGRRPFGEAAHRRTRAVPADQAIESGTAAS